MVWTGQCVNLNVCEKLRFGLNSLLSSWTSSTAPRPTKDDFSMAKKSDAYISNGKAVLKDLSSQTI